MRLRAVLSGALVLILGGCPVDDEPEEAPDCAFAGGYAEEDPALQVGAPVVQLGSGAGEAFAAWADGDTVPGRVGGQGSSMLTPTIRIVDQGEQGGSCLHVHVQVGANGEAGGALNAYEFVVEGDHLEAGPIFVLMGGGDAVVLRAVVTHGDAWQAVTEVSVNPSF